MSQVAGAFPEEPPTFETENTFPEPVKVDGDNRRFQISDDGFHAALERKQIPGPADGALGKYAEYLP